MTRKRITLENVSETKPYNHIIGFIWGVTTWGKRKGVSFEELRWAFVKGEDVAKLDRYFDEELRRFIQPFIQPGCIGNKADLCNTYLKKLLELKILRKDCRFVRPRYFLEKDFSLNEDRTTSKRCYDRFNTNQIIAWRTGWEPRILLYGLSNDFYNDNKKKVDDTIDRIEKALQEIEILKIEQLRKKFEKEGYSIEKDPDTFAAKFLPCPGVCLSRVRAPLDKMDDDWIGPLLLEEIFSELNLQK
jgi:hypothetical protein